VTAATPAPSTRASSHYVFDNLHAHPWLVDDADREVAKLASSSWVNFITNGDPDGADPPHWPSHRSKDGPVMALVHAPHKAGPEEWRERHIWSLLGLRD
jgi:carboxylesterase type B